MDYVYGIMFSDNTAKFGRSVDLWNRLYSFDSEAKRYGARIVACLISTVSDGVKHERQLLDAASSMLEHKSRESFTASSILAVSQVFDDCRIPYMACKVGESPFGPVIDSNSFSPDLSLFEKGDAVGVKASRDERIKRRILRAVDTYSGPVTDSIIRNRLLNYSHEEIQQVLDGMVGEELEKSISDNGRVMRYVRI